MRESGPTEKFLEKYRFCPEKADLVVQAWCKRKKEKCKCLIFKHLHFVGYPEPGSNRHGLLHWCLRPARLPIPPSGHSALLLAVPCGTAFLLCMGSFAIGGQSWHNFRIKRERLEIDLPVKDAKVSVFSENHKFSYLCKIYK